MVDSQGFWSYVHSDDDAEVGRISALVRDIVAQYQMRTNETIQVFLDKDVLQWGDDWESKIDGSLASVAFFIPVLTPRYFASPQCRRELNFFARRTTELGITQLLMPILYMDVPGLMDENPTDPLMSLVRTFHWKDWQELRYADVTSSEYRRAVGELADRLVQANADAERNEVVDAAIAVHESGTSDSEEAGFIELVAGAETAMPEWAQTVGALGREIEAIGSLMQEATSEINTPRQGQPTFAGRLAVIRKLSAELKTPASRIGDFGELFTQQLHDVDLGVREILKRIPDELALDNSGLETAVGFLVALRQMAIASDQGLGAMQGMIDSIAPIEKMSRDIRPPMRDLRHGLTLLLEGRDVINGWLPLVDIAEREVESAEVRQPSSSS